MLKFIQWTGASLLAMVMVSAPLELTAQPRQIPREQAVFYVNCKSVSSSFSAGQVFLKNDRSPSQHIYLIKNISSNRLWLDHPQATRGAQAGWISQLESGRWSALTVNQPQFNLSCAIPQGHSLQIISCKSTLKICELTRLAYPVQRAGNYWFVENKPKDQLLNQIAARLVGKMQ